VYCTVFRFTATLDTMPQTAVGKEVTQNRALTVNEEPFLRVCYRLMSFDVLCITEKCGASVVSVAERHVPLDPAM